MCFRSVSHKSLPSAFPSLRSSPSALAIRLPLSWFAQLGGGSFDFVTRRVQSFILEQKFRRRCQPYIDRHRWLYRKDDLENRESDCRLEQLRRNHLMRRYEALPTVSTATVVQRPCPIH